MSDDLFLPGEQLVDPFEDWCQTVDVHPEAFRAWEHFLELAASVEPAQVRFA